MALWHHLHDKPANVFSMRIQIGQIMGATSCQCRGRGAGGGQSKISWAAKGITYKKRLKACSTYIMQAKNYALLVMQPQLVFPPAALLPRHQCLQKYHHFVLNSTEAFPLASFRALPRILHGSAASHLQLTRQIQIQHSQKSSQISPLTRYCRQLSSRYVSGGLYNTRNFTEFTHIFLQLFLPCPKKFYVFYPGVNIFVSCALRALCWGFLLQQH